MSDVTVTVSGLTGSGKSAVYGEIVILLNSLGVPVKHADEAAWTSECNTTHADFASALDMYRPSVLMVELNIPRATRKKSLLRALVSAVRAALNERKDA